MASTLVVHGHFYQPPRENPWTEEVSREVSAAPAHDWNERVAAESYRPNAVARIVDDAGRVIDIVNNYANISFDVGPTLLAWLDRHDPVTYAQMLAADRAGGGGMAQGYGHTILPLATDRDARTQVRWGLADFAHRYGRPAEGMWLPEAAVNELVLAILVEEGVRFTVLAGHQAARTRPLGAPDDAWSELGESAIDIGRPWRWLHPDGSGRALDIVFYDGDLSHAVAFEIAGLSSEALVDRAALKPGDLVTIAADGETFGHHHRWGERLLAHALAVEAPRRGVEVTNVAAHLRRAEPAGQVQVRESSWSCAHGVGRWREDCGCSTGGHAGWNQRWRAPLREALDVLREGVDEVFERRGRAALVDSWAARDAYLPVVLGAVSREAFAARHIAGDRVEAFTLLEAQRAAMAMYTSCGWFFHDLAGLETVQVLRYAARALDLLDELGEGGPARLEDFLAVLAKAESNVAAEGTGRDVWQRHVQPARVDAGRVASHIALVGLLRQRAPDARVGAFAVEALDHARADRGGIALCSGRVALTHSRTGRRSEHVYAALHLGGLEVVGSTRPADPDLDWAAFAVLRGAFAEGARVTTLLRYVSDGFGPRELDLSSALPDAAEQIVEGTAQALADRFADAFEQLFSDHRETLESLAAAGYLLPAELRAPAELALGRRMESALEAGDHEAVQAVAARARAGGFVIDTPRLRAVAGPLLSSAVERAVEERGGGAAGEAVTLLGLATDLGLHVPVDRAQEQVHHARRSGARPDLAELADALGLAPD